MSKPALRTRDVPKILVVDDDPHQVDALKRLLVRERMEVLAAFSGQQCLKILRRKVAVDVIILNVMMPEMDGLEVCALLRKKASTRSIPVILLTARDDVETRQRGMEVGVSDFLLKPVSSRELVGRIRVHLKASQGAFETKKALVRMDRRARKGR